MPEHDGAAMSQTLKRGEPARGGPQGQQRPAKVQTARKQTGSAIGHVMRVQPFSDAAAPDHPDGHPRCRGGRGLRWRSDGRARHGRERSGARAHDAGFDVKRVEVRGVKRMSEQTIFEKVLASATGHAD
jgi:cell division protein FtsQ